MKKFFYILVAIWILTPFNIFAETSDLDKQRQGFIRAEHALKNHDHASYERYANQLKNYPLYPYLVYDDLKFKIHHSRPLNVNLQQIQQFEQQYPDFPFSLRKIWLTQAATNKQWAEFEKGYQTSANKELACYHLEAKFHLSKDPKVLEGAKSIWLTSYDLPAACNHLFKTWKKTGGLTQSLIWDRIKLAFDHKNMELAHHLSKHLSHPDKLKYHQWEKTLKNPQLLTQQSWINQLTLSSKAQAQMACQAIPLLAKTDAEKTLKWWQDHQKNFAFSPQQKMAIERDLGMYLSHQKSPKARTYLGRLDEKALNQTTRDWRIRLALADHDFPAALNWINQLPTSQQTEPCWRYWRARILETQGLNTQATEIYQALAKTRSYYGFLASLKLKQPLAMQHHPKAISQERLAKVQAIPAIQRFNELYALKRTSQARSEWFRIIDKLSEADKIVAAHIAHKMQLHDIAIYTITKTNYRDDVNLRFPLAFKDDILGNANQYNLDPAWIFAITRQESAFHVDAISPVGAQGLMQLMPETAKTYAKKYDIPYPSNKVLHQGPTNIKIGTVYLKNLKERMFNHSILAAAAYNAGPTRTTSWLPSKTMEADIWIENIPYKETREYVKNILTYTDIYRKQLKVEPSLAMMMRPIPTHE